MPASQLLLLYPMPPSPSTRDRVAPEAASDVPNRSSPQGTRGGWVPSTGLSRAPLTPSSYTCARGFLNGLSGSSPCPPYPLPFSNWLLGCKAKCVRAEPRLSLCSVPRDGQLLESGQKVNVLPASRRFFPKLFYSHQNGDSHVSAGPSGLGSIPLPGDCWRRTGLSGLGSSQNRRLSS